MARLGFLALVAAMVGQLGCLAEIPTRLDDLDPLQRRKRFEDTQHRFITLVRWGHIDDASRYVVPEQRAEFMALAPTVHDLRFTDYEIVEIDMAEDYQSATVDVRYRGYRLSNPVERTVDLVQKWHRDPVDGDWTVEVELAKIKSGLGVTP